MAFLEVRAACGARANVFELHTEDASIGRDAECSLQMFDPSIAVRHARLMVRRGELILAPAPGCPKGVRLSERVLRSPVVLAAGEVFELGRVVFSARIIHGESPLGQDLDGFEVLHELESEAKDVRRYRGHDAFDKPVEIALLEDAVPDKKGDAWLERMAYCAGRKSEHLREILGCGRFMGRPYAVERLEDAEVLPPGGLRLSQVERVVYTDALSLPIELVIAVLAQVAQGLASLHEHWGPHGALEPRTVLLGINGSVRLIRPGPLSIPIREMSSEPNSKIRTYSALRDPSMSFLAPERRMGQGASYSDDVWALGVLARHLLGRRPRKDWPEALDDLLVPIRANTPELRAEAFEALGVRMRALAHTLGLDPSVSHISRLVKLLASDLSRPLGVSKWTNWDQSVATVDGA